MNDEDRIIYLAVQIWRQSAIRGGLLTAESWPTDPKRLPEMKVFIDQQRRRAPKLVEEVLQDAAEYLSAIEKTYTS